MGFFSGRVSCLRFNVSGSAPRLFEQEHLDSLDKRHAGRQRIASADGVEIGWTAGDHILDTDFQLAKNIINDTLTFDLRVDVDKAPADLLRAYYSIELKALTKKNPGNATAKQKRDARDTARNRLESEAKDGRYRKRKCIPVLWDRYSNEVLFGATSIAHVDRLCNLFQQTFGLELECITSGRRAYQLAELHSRTRVVEDSAPSAFVPGFTPPDVAWIADESSRDFLGNEFLLWLWYRTDVVSDTFKLLDDSEATVMLARTLTLECPRGQTGHETISSDGPAKLPEAKRAVQSGKLPRKMGLTIVRHGAQYELTLQAETLAISGCKMPAPDEEITEARAKLEERATQIRSLIETLDLLYDDFGKKRFGKEWEAELAAMQKWLKREDRRTA